MDMCELVRTGKGDYQGTLLKAHIIMQPNCLIQNSPPIPQEAKSGMIRYCSQDNNEYASSLTELSTERSIHCRQPNFPLVKVQGHIKIMLILKRENG